MRRTRAINPVPLHARRRDLAAGFCGGGHEVEASRFATAAALGWPVYGRRPLNSRG